MHTYYRILTTNGFYRDSGTPSPYPSNPRMGNTQSMSHPGCFHDMPNLHHSDDKTVHRLSGVQTLDNKIVCGFGGEQNSGFDLFSRITAIRKDSKNENSTHSSLLESEVLFLFFYCRRQRYSRNSLQAKQSFAESFLHALLFLEKAGSTA